MLKLCKDCFWHRKVERSAEWLNSDICVHPVFTLDPVDGEAVSLGMVCGDARHKSELCGPHGSLWSFDVK
jgi:hypothetical protein